MFVQFIIEQYAKTQKKKIIKMDYVENHVHLNQSLARASERSLRHSHHESQIEKPLHWNPFISRLVGNCIFLFILKNWDISAPNKNKPINHVFDTLALHKLTQSTSSVSGAGL